MKYRGNKKRLMALALVAVGGLIALTAPKEREVRAEAAQNPEGRVKGGHGLFPHDQKDHMRVDCVKCHSVSATSDQPVVKEFTHDKCASCHNFALEVFKQAAGRPVMFCAVCHDGRPQSKLQSALLPMFPKPKESDFGERFSHEAHRKSLPAYLTIRPVDMRGGRYGSQFRVGTRARCMDCHQLIMPMAPSVRDIRTETGHPACFVCHGQQPSARGMPAEAFPYMGDCASCHQLGGPRGRDILGNVVRFKHQDHDLDTRPRHKSEYPLGALPERLCSECHQSVVAAKGLDQIALPKEGYCGQCHNGKLGLPDGLAQDVLNDLRRR